MGIGCGFLIRRNRSTHDPPLARYLTTKVRYPPDFYVMINQLVTEIDSAYFQMASNFPFENSP